jgi:hypothetical protein
MTQMRSDGPDRTLGQRSRRADRELAQKNHNTSVPGRSCTVIDSLAAENRDSRVPSQDLSNPCRAFQLCDFYPAEQAVNGQRDFPVGGQLISLLADT